MSMETDVNLHDIEDYDAELPHDQLPSVEEVRTTVGGTKPINSTNKKLFYILASVTIFVVLIVAIAVPSKGKPRGNKQIGHNIGRDVNRIALNGKKDFKNSNSYQSFAKRWLEEDALVKNYTYNKLQERYAMYCLYHATDPQGWVDATGWKRKGVPECEWYGVSCDLSTGMVTRINLRNNGLGGEIPPEVSLIPQLQVFNVKSNVNLTGQIPSDVCDLHARRGLDVKVDCATVTCSCCASCA